MRDSVRREAHSTFFSKINDRFSVEIALALRASRRAGMGREYALATDRFREADFSGRFPATNLESGVTQPDPLRSDKHLKSGRCQRAAL